MIVPFKKWLHIVERLHSCHITQLRENSGFNVYLPWEISSSDLFKTLTNKSMQNFASCHVHPELIWSSWILSSHGRLSRYQPTADFHFKLSVKNLNGYDPLSRTIVSIKMVVSLVTLLLLLLLLYTKKRNTMTNTTSSLLLLVSV